MAVAVEVEESLTAKFAALLPHLDERQQRLYLGSEARSLGHGGVAAVARAAGVSRPTVTAGVAELEAGEQPLGRARRAGGGRKPLAGTDPGLRPALLALVDPGSRGDPESPLRWTTLSTRNLAAELTRQGHPAGPDTVAKLLKEERFSLQGNAKTAEGARHPDRDAQFRYINGHAREHLDAGQPVISVDAKKKENVGSFKNGGREWRPKGSPEPVNVHDFKDKDLGKVTPYGVYDIATNAGWVSVGTDHDTAEFAVATIRAWWRKVGSLAYPDATRLLITADGGGSNGYRTRLWKTELAALAEQTGLETPYAPPPGRGLRPPVRGVPLGGRAVGLLDGAQSGGDPGLAGSDGLAVAPAVGALGQVAAGPLDFTDVGLSLVGVRGDGEHGDVGRGGVQDQADRLGLGVAAGQRKDPGTLVVGPGLLRMDPAVPDPVVELGEHHVRAVDLVAGGGEVLPDRAEFGAPVVCVSHEPGGLRLVREAAGAGVFAQLVLEVRVDGSGFDEADQAVGEVAFLGPGGQPDGQRPGGDVVDDGAAAVGFGEAIGNELLVQAQVRQRPVHGQPVVGSCRRFYAVIGLIHRSHGVSRGLGELSLGDAGEFRPMPCLAVQSAASRSGGRLACSCWRLMSPGS